MAKNRSAPRCFRRYVSIASFVACAWMPTVASAAEVRVLDENGLVRALKVTRGPSRIVVAIGLPYEQIGAKARASRCVAVNVDGLGAEKSVAISGKGECVFDEMSEGTWQVRVPEQLPWRAQIYE